MRFFPRAAAGAASVEACGAQRARAGYSRCATQCAHIAAALNAMRRFVHSAAILPSKLTASDLL